MNFDHLLENAGDLIQHMKENHYSDYYIQNLQKELNWLRKHKNDYGSYQALCKARQACVTNESYKQQCRSLYGIMMRFDLEGAYPDRKHHDPFRQNSYSNLCPSYREIIDQYQKNVKRQGLKCNTIKSYVSCGSNFLLNMQDQGLLSLENITEQHVLSYFTDDSGLPKFSFFQSSRIKSIFSSDLGVYTDEARRIGSYIPISRPRRKNIQYLQPEEIESILEVLDIGTPSKITWRDRAVGIILYYTGLRRCDIAGLQMSDIDWVNDKINIIQAKTEVKLELPLIPVVGNAIHDYIVLERPKIDYPHIFLGSKLPHDPLQSTTIGAIADNIYKAAGVRQEKGDRRGTHIFRHHLVTTLINSGISSPIASAIVGHSNPASLDAYFYADIEHLRECALSIAEFPVREGLFDR